MFTVSTQEISKRDTEEYQASSETHHDDGDWDYYARYFLTQLSETLMINFHEYLMKYISGG
jgi:hypothetical protein